MAGVGGCIIIGLVAINTFDPKRAKIKKGCRCIDMAVIAICSNMRADKRKAASLMDLGNVIYNP